MGFSHQYVCLLTHVVSRHMMHSTQTHPCAFLPMVLSRARACACAHRRIPAYVPQTLCKPRWRPNGAGHVCWSRHGGSYRPRALTDTIRSCIDTKSVHRRSKQQTKVSLDEYQIEADVRKNLIKSSKLWPRPQSKVANVT